MTTAASYYAFLSGLGSLLVATLGAPVWVAPRFFGFGRKMVGWLMAAVAVRAVADAPELMFNDASATPLLSELQRVALALSMIVFAEAARCAAEISGHRQPSAWWHVPAAAAWAFHLAVLISADFAQWAGLAGRVSWLVPATVGAYSIVGIWRSLKRTRVPPRRLAMKVSASAFTLANLLALESAPGVRDGTMTALIWVTAVALAALVLTLPEFRRRVALGLVLTLAAVPFLGPLLCELNIRWVQGRFESHLRMVAAEESRAPGVTFAAGPAAGDGEAAALTAQLRALRRRDPSLRDAYFWELANERVWRFEATGNSVTLVPFRAAAPAEVAQLAAGRPFVLRALDDENGGFVAGEAQVRPAAPGRPAVWLAAEYPAAVWTLQTENARRNAASLVALFAVFVGAGLILGSAQALENAGQTRIYRAVAADRAKREFLAFLSHELRTPLQSVLGRAELLQRAPLTAAEQVQVAAILEDGRLLLRLVTDLLDLGAIEAGRLQLRPAPFSLPATLHALAAAYRPRADAKGLTLAVEIAPGVPEFVHADESRLRQMLGNFLSNAVKYTERGGVTLLARPAGAAAEDSGDEAADEPVPPAPPKPDHLAATSRVLDFVVRDTGPGVPPAQIDRLFSLFTRVDAGNAFRREGTGVGLALVRRLCTLMGGRVWAANRPEGGAEFTLRLNFPLAAGEDVRAAEERAAAGPPLYGGHALVVEDNPNARAWLEDALKLLGFSVQSVGHGAAAVEAAARGGIDVVLLDINLPDMDGLTVARELRAGQPDLRIIGCSAEAFAAAREAALAAGMDAYLVKPVSLAVLEKTLGPGVAAPRDVFARLQSAETTRLALAQVRGDWPRMRAETEKALAAGDREALRRLGHYLKSSALLLNDERLGELCRRLSRTAAEGGSEDDPALLQEVGRHLAGDPETAREP